jgi:hypothetical protein
MWKMDTRTSQLRALNREDDIGGLRKNKQRKRNRKSGLTDNMQE